MKLVEYQCEMERLKCTLTLFSRTTNSKQQKGEVGPSEKKNDMDEMKYISGQNQRSHPRKTEVERHEKWKMTGFEF